MFKIKAILDSSAFDSLPETIDPKELFQKNEKDDNYVLALDGAEAGLLAKPLQTEKELLVANNAKLVEEKKEALEALKPFKDLGKTVQELTDIINDKTPQDIATLTQTHKTEMESLRTSTQTELEAASTKVKELEEEVLRDKRNFAIDKAIQSTGATPLAFDYLKDRVEVVKVEGSKDYAVRVKDDKGEIAYKGGAPMTPAQLLDEKKTDPIYSGMFFAGESGGTGTRTSGTGISSKGTIKADDSATFGANLEDIASGKVKVVGLGE